MQQKYCLKEQYVTQVDAKQKKYIHNQNTKHNNILLK